MAILDVDALLAPIPGDDPAGSALPFSVREQLETLRKEDDPNAYAADDPMRPTEFKRADWNGIVKLASKALMTQSKDLLVAARLVEAVTKAHGFPGLAEGMNLLRRIVEECWDRLWPPLDDPSDLDIRSGPINWVSDADRGARFPATIRSVPIVSDSERGYGWLDWQKGQDARQQALRDGFEKAVTFTTRDQCQQNFDALSSAQQEFDALNLGLTNHMGPLAPSMTGLKQALIDVRGLAEQILRRKGPAAAAETTATTPSSAVSGPVAANGPALDATTLVANRDDIYRRLHELANLLQQMEPHSPIPYLLQRAVELGAMPFPQLMQALIRDTSVLSQMNRELGIKSDKSDDD